MSILYKLAKGAESPENSWIVPLRACINEDSVFSIFNNHNKKIEMTAKKDNRGRIGVVLHPGFKVIMSSGLIATEAIGSSVKIYCHEQALDDIGVAIAGGSQIIELTNEDKLIEIRLVNTSNQAVWIFDKDVIAKAVFENHRKTNILKLAE